MHRTFITLAAPAALVAALIAAPAAASPLVLEPQSPWNVDFGDQSCRLARAFSNGADTHMLYFEQFWPATGAGLTVAGKAFNRFDGGINTPLHVAEGRASFDTRPFKGNIEGVGAALVYPGINLGYGESGAAPPPSGPGLPALDTAYAESVEFLAFRQRGREVRFATGPLGKAFGVLNQCAADLVNKWGLDAERHKTAQRLPQWINEAAVVGQIKARYPLGARNIGEQAITRLRVTVSEAGAVEDCVVLKATTTTKLESPACEAMQDARFEPALDAAGAPMRSFYVTSITYKIG